MQQTNDALQELNSTRVLTEADQVKSDEIYRKENRSGFLET